MRAFLISHTYILLLWQTSYFISKNTQRVFEGVRIYVRAHHGKRETKNSGDDVIWIVQPNWVAQLILINSTSRAANFLRAHADLVRHDFQMRTTLFVCGCPLIANQEYILIESAENTEIKSYLNGCNIFENWAKRTEMNKILWLQMSINNERHWIDKKRVSFSSVKIFFAVVLKG